MWSRSGREGAVAGILALLVGCGAGERSRTQSEPVAEPDPEPDHPPAARDQALGLSELARDRERPTALTIMGGQLYFADANEVWRVGLGGGAPVRVERLPAPITAMAADGRRLFVATASALYRIEAGKLELIPGAGGARRLRVVEDRVWLRGAAALDLAPDSEGKSVFPVPERRSRGASVLAGNDEVVADTPADVGVGRPGSGAAGLAVGPTHAWWIEGDRIRRRPVDGGDAEDWGRTGGGHVDLAADATHLYWGDATLDAVLRRASSGGPIELVALGFGRGGRIELDVGQVFVVDIDSSVTRIDKASREGVRTPPFIGRMGAEGIGVALVGEWLCIGVDRWRTSGVVDGEKAVAVEFEGEVACAARPLEGTRVLAPTDLRGLGASFSPAELDALMPASG